MFKQHLKVSKKSCIVRDAAFNYKYISNRYA